MNQTEEYPKVKRKPIMLHCNTVALVEIFHKPSTFDDDFGFFWEAAGNDPNNYEEEAKDFMNQIGDEMCIAFMDELQKLLKAEVDNHKEKVEERNKWNLK